MLVGQGGWPGAVSGCVAAGECSCEAIRSGLVVQPANTITSLSFVLVAAAIPWLGPAADDRAVLGKDAIRIVAAAVLVTGMGSTAFHASLTDWAGTADLVGSASIAIFAINYRSAQLRSLPLAFWLTLFAAIAVFQLVGTENGKYLLTVLVAMAALAEVRWLRRQESVANLSWLAAAALVLGVGVAIWWFSRDGYVLCSPGSKWQWHGLWHVAAATALLGLFLYYRGEMWNSAGKRIRS